MSRSGPTIVFVGHDASRSGAPIILLNLLRWLNTHSTAELRLVLIQGGPLESDFKSVLPTTVLTSRKWRKWKALRRVVSWLGLSSIGTKIFRNRLQAWMAGNADRPDLIYLNTVVTGHILPWITPAWCPIICHVHELTFSIALSLSPPSLKVLTDQVSHFVACAEVVRSHLQTALRIDTDRITTVHEFIQVKAGNADEARGRIISELGISSDAIIVGAAGQMCWRKGTDLFLQVARAVVQREAKLSVHFVWFGGVDPTWALMQAEYDIEKGGLTGHVHLAGTREDLSAYLAGLDIFILTSREDPFPLVCLEAAAAACPLICFANAGGIPEFVEDDCGVVVPYLDVEAMATTLIELARAPERRKAMGRNGKSKVRHFDISVAAPKILSLLQSLTDTKTLP